MGFVNLWGVINNQCLIVRISIDDGIEHEIQVSLEQIISDGKINITINVDNSEEDAVNKVTKKGKMYSNFLLITY